MKKRKKILTIIGSVIAVIFGVLTYVYFWGTRFAGDLNNFGGVIPQAKADLTELTVEGPGWPQFLGPYGNDVGEFIGIDSAVSNGLIKKWEIDYLCRGPKSMSYSSPAVSGNRLLVTGHDEKNNFLFCLSPENGDLLWYKKYPEKSKNNYGMGDRATPTISGKTVYTVSREGIIRCHSIYDGKLIWSFHLKSIGCKPPEWGFSGSPVLHDKNVIFHAGGDSLAVSLNRETGVVTWKSSAGKGGYSTPVIVSNAGLSQLILFYHDGVRSLNLDDGSDLWDTPMWVSGNRLIITTPVVRDNQIFLSSYWGVGSKLIRINESGAETVWHNKKAMCYQANPHIIGDEIYFYDGAPMQNRGHFTALDFKTGIKKWSVRELGMGTTIRAGGYLICQNVKGVLYFVKTNSKKPVIARAITNAMPDVPGNQYQWTKPIAAGKYLYLRHGPKLICFSAAW